MSEQFETSQKIYQFLNQFLRANHLPFLDKIQMLSVGEGKLYIGETLLRDKQNYADTIKKDEPCYGNYINTVIPLTERTGIDPEREKLLNELLQDVMIISPNGIILRGIKMLVEGYLPRYIFVTDHYQHPEQSEELCLLFEIGSDQWFERVRALFGRMPTQPPLVQCRRFPNLWYGLTHLVTTVGDQEYIRTRCYENFRFVSAILSRQGIQFCGTGFRVERLPSEREYIVCYLDTLTRPLEFSGINESVHSYENNTKFSKLISHKTIIIDANGYLIHGLDSITQGHIPRKIIVFYCSDVHRYAMLYDVDIDKTPPQHGQCFHTIGKCLRHLYKSIAK